MVVQESSALDAKLQRALDTRRRVGTLRTLQPQTLNCVDFFSNDYLGFAQSKPLQACVAQRKDELANEHLLLGSTGSRLISGNSSYFMQVEKELAAFYNRCVVYVDGRGRNGHSSRIESSVNALSGHTRR